MPISRYTERVTARARNDAVPADSRLMRSILLALGDAYSRDILGSVMTEGKTVDEIAAETGIPRSSCYKRVQQLVGKRLLFRETFRFTRAGKKHAVYRARFFSFTVRLDSGNVELEIRSEELALPSPSLAREW